MLMATLFRDVLIKLLKSKQILVFSLDTKTGNMLSSPSSLKGDVAGTKIAGATRGQAETQASA
jgi:hypothetical protein